MKRPTNIHLDKPDDRGEEAPYTFLAYSTDVFSAPGVYVEAGSDSSPSEALERIYDALEERGLIDPREIVEIHDPEGLLDAYPPEKNKDEPDPRKHEKE